MIGSPGSVNTNGTNQTHIGNDGKADYERHNSDHNKPWAHTNPHDHKIDWANGYPHFEGPINYPNDAPPFENVYGGNESMNIGSTSGETNAGCKFTSISDFKWCMRCGGEVEFVWNGITYSITHYGGKISISHSRSQTTEMCRDTADEILEYMVGSNKLRDVITQVTVIDRTI